MIEQEFIKVATQFQATDESEVVKVAGILNKLKNLFKQITNPYYREAVQNMRLEGGALGDAAKNLNKHLKDLQSALKDGDVYKYKRSKISVDNALEEFKRTKEALDGKAEKLVELGVQEVQNPGTIDEVARQYIARYPENDIEVGKEYEGRSLNEFVSLRNIKNVYICTGKGRNASHVLVGKLATVLSNPKTRKERNAYIKEKFSKDSLDLLFKAFTDAVLAGELISVNLYEDKDGENKSRKYPWTILKVKSAPFVVPNIGATVQATVLLQDKRGDLANPNGSISLFRTESIDVLEGAQEGIKPEMEVPKPPKSLTEVVESIPETQPTTEPAVEEAVEKSVEESIESPAGNPEEEAARSYQERTQEAVEYARQPGLLSEVPGAPVPENLQDIINKMKEEKEEPEPEPEPAPKPKAKPKKKPKAKPKKEPAPAPAPAPAPEPPPAPEAETPATPGLSARDAATLERAREAHAAGKKLTKAQKRLFDVHGPGEPTKEANLRGLYDSLVKYADQVPYTVTKLSQLEFAEAMREGYRIAFGHDPTLETLAGGWAQAVLECGRPIKLPNNNVGNIKAEQGWVKSGKPYFVKDTREFTETGKGYAHKGAAWKAFSSPAEGAAFYWKYIGKRFGRAMDWMAAGDPLSAAVVMGTPTKCVTLKNGEEKCYGAYYTAPIGPSEGGKTGYSDRVAAIYDEFMKKIAPRMSGLKSEPAPPPGPKPIVKRWSGDYTKEEREQILGKKYSGEPLDQPTQIAKTETPVNDTEIDQLISKLVASPLTNIVKRAILKKKLPKSTSLIMLTSNHATSIEKMEFARVVASVLDNYLDIDARVCKKGDDIQVHCVGSGTEMVMTGAIQSVCEMVSSNMINKTGTRIYATAIAGGASTFDEVHSDMLIKNRKHFNMRRIANVG